MDTTITPTCMSNRIRRNELSEAQPQPIRFLAVEFAHPGSSSRFGTVARIFLGSFRELTSVILLVVGDVPIDSEMYVMTSSNLRSVGSVF